MTPRKRLQVLCNYLRSGAVDEAEFDMRWWPSCAIGEASRIPTLHNDGLVLDDSNEPAYNNYLGYSAVAEFFRIPYARVGTVFGRRQRSPRQVAAVIEQMYLQRRTP